MNKKTKSKQQEAQFMNFLTCPAEELEGWYNAYVNGYPRHVAPLIKALAAARGLDTSTWKEFYV